MTAEDERQLGDLEGALQRRLSSWRWRIRADVMREVAEHMGRTAVDIQAEMDSMLAGLNKSATARVGNSPRYLELKGALMTRVTARDWAEAAEADSTAKAEKAERTADAAGRRL